MYASVTRSTACRPVVATIAVSTAPALHSPYASSPRSAAAANAAASAPPAACGSSAAVSASKPVCARAGAGWGRPG